MSNEREHRLGDFFASRREPGVDGLPIMSVTLHDGMVDREELERRTETSLTPKQHLRVRKGDIAYNMMRMWQGASGLAEKDGIVSPAYVVLRPKSGIDSRFAFHWFKSARMIHYFWAYSHGLTEDRLRLYFDDFCQIPAVPPSPELQRRIAAALDVWDRAIKAAAALVVAKRRRKAELMRRLMLGVEGRRGFLSDIAEINPANPRVGNDTTVSFIAMEDVSDDGRLLRHHPVRRGNLATGYTGFQDGDVLVAKITPCFENGKGAFLQGLYGGTGFGSTEFHVVRAQDPSDARFVYQHTLTRTFRINGARFMTGSAGQRRVPAEFIKDYPLPIPAPTTRQRVAALLDAADSEIEWHVAHVEALRKQKCGLVQKLFTGEWQLPDFDRAAPRSVLAAQ